ncbi:hypothetical protein ASZ90_010094 [hydrocarbon metagenome]|uniref:Uncharacterized protein n=1 Tax=hydrocarbon metagenome TaxID=938273 RepID=A0A0W8FH19_9ZZZZ
MWQREEQGQAVGLPGNDGMMCRSVAMPAAYGSSKVVHQENTSTLPVVYCFQTVPPADIMDLPGICLRPSRNTPPGLDFQRNFHMNSHATGIGASAAMKIFEFCADTPGPVSLLWFSRDSGPRGQSPGGGGDPLPL